MLGIKFIIQQAKNQITEFKRMSHQLKMEMITLRERAFFETNDIPQDSQTLIESLSKRLKSQCEFYEGETYKATRELQEIRREKMDLEEKIINALEKLEALETTTGSYGLYYSALMNSDAKQR